MQLSDQRTKLFTSISEDMEVKSYSFVANGVENELVPVDPRRVCLLLTHGGAAAEAINIVNPYDTDMEILLAPLPTILEFNLSSHWVFPQLGVNVASTATIGVVFKAFGIRFRK